MIGANALFTDVNRPLQWEFEYLAEKVYKSAVHPVNFMNPSASVSIINQWVANITQNRIAQLVQEGRLTRLLFSTLHLFVMMYLFLYVTVLYLF
jgi:serine protease inhibitor